ncbi:MAG: LysM domain-containing protein [Victivallaceae bacterium]|jgi:LysM repeat protein
MRSFYFMACVLLVGTFGCAPQLAQKPMGEEEVRWEKYVKKNYSSWTPPQTIPPDKILNPTPVDKGEVVLTPEGPAASGTPAAGQEGAVVESAPAVTGTAAPAPVLTDDKTAAPAPAAALAPEAPAGKTETYTVVKNDSLGKIAKKFKTTTSKIKAANQKVLKGGDRIIPGMKLQIPR